MGNARRINVAALCCLILGLACNGILVGGIYIASHDRRQFAGIYWAMWTLAIWVVCFAITLICGLLSLAHVTTVESRKVSLSTVCGWILAMISAALVVLGLMMLQ